MAKAASGAKKPKSPTKSEILASVADSTQLTKKQVSSVMEALHAEISKAISKKGPGVFIIPGLVKIMRSNVPAKPARKGVMVLGQLRDLPAKPASTKVKVRPLKDLKGML